MVYQAAPENFLWLILDVFLLYHTYYYYKIFPCFHCPDTIRKSGPRFNPWPDSDKPIYVFYQSFAIGFIVGKSFPISHQFSFFLKGSIFKPFNFLSKYYNKIYCQELALNGRILVVITVVFGCNL